MGSFCDPYRESLYSAEIRLNSGTVRQSSSLECKLFKIKSAVHHEWRMYLTWKHLLQKKTRMYALRAFILSPLQGPHRGKRIDRIPYEDICKLDTWHHVQSSLKLTSACQHVAKLGTMNTRILIMAMLCILENISLGSVKLMWQSFKSEILYKNLIFQFKFYS